MKYPLEGRTHLADGIDFDSAPDSDRVSKLHEQPPLNIGCGVDTAQVVISRSVNDPNEHYLLIDLDIPAWLIPSSNNHHLYIDKAMPWSTYRALLVALEVTGIVGKGTVDAALHRGFTALRLPWVRKQGTGDVVGLCTASYGLENGEKVRCTVVGPHTEHEAIFKWGRY